MGLPAEALVRGGQVMGAHTPAAALLAALLRVHALELHAAGNPQAAAAVLAQARGYEVTPPSAAQLDTLQAVGWLTPGRRLTGAGLNMLVAVLDHAPEGGEP